MCYVFSVTGRRNDDWISLRLPKQDKEELERLAELEERTLAGMVRLAVRQLLQDRKERAQ